jgi:hypothetical protein
MSYKFNKLLLHQFTTYNLIGFALGSRIHPFLVEVNKSTSWMIMFASIVITTIHGHQALLDIYQSISKLPYKDILVYLNDMLLHWLPAIAQGVPMCPIAILIGLALIIVWYFANRKKIQYLYSTSITQPEYDRLIGGVAVFALALLMVQIISRSSV